MVPYFKEKNPSLPQWVGGIQATVVLDQPANFALTNLDQIRGKVVVRCGKSTEIASIVAKLEGESLTRLVMRKTEHYDTAKPRLEYHRILYRTQTVFPLPELLETSGARASGKFAYTLQQGVHEYPFTFKIPFNNSCLANQYQISSFKITTGGIEANKPAPSHVKQTLPPTLSGFPGEAEIRYFVKVTIIRQSFWKENLRAFAPFNFIPIEPPRPPVSGTEIYARQRHAFEITGSNEGTKPKGKGIFSFKEKRNSIFASLSSSSQAANISVDARLPEPPILTCNGDVPLRIIVKKLDDGNGVVYLQSLQIKLLSFTNIRAHEVHRTETENYMLVSRSNLGIPLAAASDPAGTEALVDEGMWRGQRLPNTVAPSFQTCNIERTYQLDLRVGLSCTSPSQSLGKAPVVVLPLRLDVKVYSGIAPPPQLLAAMENSGAVKASAPPPTTSKSQERLDEKTASKDKDGQSGGSSNVKQAPQYSDAPPSYEDAMASELPPVNAPRPDYTPAPAEEGSMLGDDEKKPSLSRYASV